MVQKTIREADRPPYEVPVRCVLWPEPFTEKNKFIGVSGKPNRPFMTSFFSSILEPIYEELGKGVGGAVSKVENGGLEGGLRGSVVVRYTEEMEVEEVEDVVVGVLEKVLGLGSVAKGERGEGEGRVDLVGAGVDSMALLLIRSSLERFFLLCFLNLSLPSFLTN